MFLTNRQQFDGYVREDGMEGEDLKTLGTAIMFFRGAAEAQAAAVELAATHAVAPRPVEADGWTPPPWGLGWYANMRTLDIGKPVVDRVLAGWTPPDLDAVMAVGGVTEQAMYQARQRFILAAGAVAAEVAVHGAPFPYTLEDQSQYRRVENGSFPAQAEALLPAARDALTDWAVLWASMAGHLPGARFLPGVLA